MSARPELSRLPEEELNLLISRYLDGDLSPEESRDLESLLAQDPEARRRHAEMAALVGKVKGLPSPEPPFALATRVTAQVQERTKGFSGVAHRIGFFPSPGMIAAVTGGLALVIAVGVFRESFFGKPVPAQVTAEKVEAPVRVFLQESAPTKDDKQAAPQEAPAAAPQDAPAEERKRIAMVAPQKGAKSADSDASASGSIAANEDRRATDEFKEKAEPAYAPEVAAAAPPPARPAVAAVEQGTSQGGARREETDALSKVESEATTRRQAPAAPAPAMVGATAFRDDAAPRAKKQAVAATLAIVPRSGRVESWRLPPPAGPAGVRGPLNETYRLWVDASGRVSSITPLTSPPPVREDVERLLRSLVLTPESGVASTPDVDVRVVVP